MTSLKKIAWNPFIPTFFEEVEDIDPTGENDSDSLSVPCSGNSGNDDTFTEESE
jgi:hypothetical protein